MRLSETLSTALLVHSHIIVDVGDCLGQLIRSHRHLWLAETSLPPAVRARLVALPVEPGRVFHPSTREVLEQAGEARRTREKICAASRKPDPPPSTSGARGRGGSPRLPPFQTRPPFRPARAEAERSFHGRAKRCAVIWGTGEAGRPLAMTVRGGLWVPASATEVDCGWDEVWTPGPSR